MKPLTKDLARTGALVALATGSVLIPLRSLHRSAAPPAPPKSETLAVELFAAPQEGPDMQSIGVAINDNNEVVATAFNEKTIRAFTVKGRKWALLPLPKGMTQSVAAGINADGIVVGTVGAGDLARGLLWHGDKMGMLVSGQKNTSASTVSKTGVAAGIAITAPEGVAVPMAQDFRFSLTFSGIERRFAFAPSAMDFTGMVWPRPGEGKSIGEFVPQAGSPSGTLVGLAVGKSGPTPAVFQSGKLGSLPKPEGVKMAIPLAANDADVFVGAGVEGENKVRPIGWSKGKTGFLPVPGGRRGMALGINDAKTVVGVIEAESGEAHAAVWLGGKVVDLNEIAKPPAGWTLVQARGINNKGYVVGTAFNKEDDWVLTFVVGPVK